MFEKPASLITASLAGLSWIEQLDLLLRWSAAGVAIVLGLIQIYKLLRK